MHLLYICLIVYLVGVSITILIFEMVWAKTYRLRIVNDKFDEHYPAFYRTDAKYSQKWRHYINLLTGAQFIRLTIGIPLFLSTAVYAKICLLG